jgi:hypothetical protein
MVWVLRAVLIGLVGLLLLLPGRAFAQPDPAEVVRVLFREDVYIEPAMAGRLSAAERERLNAKAAELRSRGWTVKFVLISRQPAGFQNLGEFTSQLHRYLGLGDGLLIVASQNAVSARTDRLGRDETQQLTDASRRVFTAEGYAAGMIYLADSIVAEAEARSAATRTATIGLGLILGVGILGLVGFLAVRTGSARRGRLSQLRDWHAGLTAAALDFDQAVGPAPLSPRLQDARRTLDLALDELAAAGSKLDRLDRAGLLGPAPRDLDEVARTLFQVRDRLSTLAQSLADEAPEIRDIRLPEMGVGRGEPGPTERLACFFCARPLRPEEAREVVLDFGRERRRVVVDPDHYEALRQGEYPPVRTVEVGGRRVPWFEDPNFDPRRDYRPSYSGMGLPELLILWGLMSHPVTVVTGPAEASRPEPADDGRDTWFESPFFGPPGSEAEGAAESPFDFGVEPGNQAAESDFDLDIGDAGDFDAGFDVDAGVDG